MADEWTQPAQPHSDAEPVKGPIFTRDALLRDLRKASTPHSACARAAFNDGAARRAALAEKHALDAADRQRKRTP